MKALIESGLLFGSLERVDSPHMVARYNSALAGLGIGQTGLETFHVDATGHSPEIAQEKGDEDYLNPQGVNRFYVILSPRQRNLPVIRSGLSADQSVYRQYFDANMRAIETLTLHDAVFGEMENFVMTVDEPEDLIGFRRITFSMRTPSGLVERAQRLKANAGRFVAEQDAWRDEALMQSIVEDAKACGDFRRNGILPERLGFLWPDVYHAQYFGGVHVIRRENETVLVGNETLIEPKPKGNVRILDIQDASKVGSLLEEAGYIEDLNRDWLLESGVLHHRLAMLGAETLIKAGRRFNQSALTNPADFSRLAVANMDVLWKYSAFRGLHELRSAMLNGGDYRAVYQEMSPRLRMSVLRALPDTDTVWDVNRLIAEYTLYDPVTLFILNKGRFYARYAEMGEDWRALAVFLIKAIYHPDTDDLQRHKNTVRELFFGTH